MLYVAHVRNGFVPASRRQVFERIRHLVSPTMPFANLPDTHKSRWGDELTADPRLWHKSSFWREIGCGMQSVGLPPGGIDVAIKQYHDLKRDKVALKRPKKPGRRFQRYNRGQL